MSIPKLIHQTWKTKELPKKQKEWSLQIQKMHPTYKYRLWTDEDLDLFVKEHFPQYYEDWKNMIIIRKVDIWRYMVLYVHGGVYADLDIECIKPFDDLLSSTYEIRLTNPVDPCFMISAPGHSFWLQALELWHSRLLKVQNLTKIEKIQEYIHHSYIFTIYLTGPLMLESLYKTEFYDDKTILILHNNDVVVNSNDTAIYAKHHNSCSWTPFNPWFNISLAIVFTLIVIFLCIFAIIVFRWNPYIVSILGLLLLCLIVLIIYFSMTFRYIEKSKKKE